MKQIVDRDELCDLYVLLTDNHRECVMAVVRALAYAQENPQELRQDNNKEQKGI